MIKIRKLLILIMILSVSLALPLFGKPNSISASDDARGKVTLLKYPGFYNCFLIESDQGVKIIVDPFNMDKKTRADIVTVSHDHSDHCDFSMISSPFTLIQTCGEFSEKGVKITGIPGVHNRGDRVLSNIIYVFDIAGIRIAEFASQGERPEQEKIKKIGKVDVLIIQCYNNVPDKITVGEAGAIAQDLMAKIVIPAHCDNSALVLNGLAQILSKQDYVPVKSGKLTLTRADLDQMTSPQVMVLDH